MSWPGVNSRLYTLELPQCHRLSDNPKRIFTFSVFTLNPKKTITDYHGNLKVQ